MKQHIKQYIVISYNNHPFTILHIHFPPFTVFPVPFIHIFLPYTRLIHASIVGEYCQYYTDWLCYFMKVLVYFRFLINQFIKCFSLNIGYIDEFLFLNILIDTKSQPSLQFQDNEHNSIKKEPQATNLYLIVWGSRFYILNYSNKL